MDDARRTGFLAALVILGLLVLVMLLIRHTSPNPPKTWVYEPGSMVRLRCDGRKAVVTQTWNKAGNPGDCESYMIRIEGEARETHVYVFELEPASQ